MKRIVKIGLTAFSFLMLGCVIVNAQEKDKVKHIRIVSSDKSGKVTEIDTIITAKNGPDSLKFKNGEVIYLTRHDGGGNTISHKGSETMLVTHSSDNGSGDNKTNRVIIITGDKDSAKVIEHGDVVIINSGNSGHKSSSYTVTTDANNTKGANYFYVTDSKGKGDTKEKTIEVRVTSDGNDKTVEKTRYVIAKDGMVVTVEGNDEAKAKEIIDDVKAKLGVNEGTKEKGDKGDKGKK